MAFVRDEKNAIFVFLLYSIAYAIEYRRRIPVPQEPLNESEVPETVSNGCIDPGVH